MRPRHRGFSLVELVVVMVLMTILTAVGMSRFSSREPFAVQSAADQLMSGLRLAQNTAVARRATLYVNLQANPAALNVCLDNTCTQALEPPGGGSWLDTQGDIRLAAALSYSVDGAGVPSFATAQTVQVTNSNGAVQAPAIRIEPVSGHVHVP
jgi:prepilin-type N-terminal cleavage/methylation domain-containing protein